MYNTYHLASNRINDDDHSINEFYIDFGEDTTQGNTHFVYIDPDPKIGYFF